MIGALHCSLTDSQTSDGALVDACVALGHLLTVKRARQLFLHPSMAGVSALLRVHRRGGAAAEAVRRVLETLCDIGNSETGDAGQEPAARERQHAPADGMIDLGDCCICLDKIKTHAFLPCGHLCSCMDCASFLAAQREPCPICRRPIQRAAQIFV